MLAIVKDWFSSKTNVAALVALLVAVAELLGFDVTPALDQDTAWNAVWAAATAIFMRDAIRKVS